ncbi:methyltransferase domain-containing protein [Enterococcus avium]|nr:class I SAM-dependent methyltransferase [Enterococcus avium]NVN75691.1 methyltransferase domain-containing protein [Enterococcus avium]
MNRFFILLIIVVGLAFIYKYLLNQSKAPTGWVGIVMMKLWNKVYLPMAKWCLSFLPEKQFHRILDIGVGNGATTYYLSQRFKAESIIGIDITEKAIEQAQRLHSGNTITFEKANIENTNYPSNSFDLICAFQNHFHWNNLQGRLLEIRRILTDDGILLIGCEYSKVKYFLPELKEPDLFGEYLDDVGLRLVQVERERDWVVYWVGKRLAE